MHFFKRLYSDDINIAERDSLNISTCMCQFSCFHDKTPEPQTDGGVGSTTMSEKCSTKHNINICCSKPQQPTQTTHKTHINTDRGKHG